MVILLLIARLKLADDVSPILICVISLFVDVINLEKPTMTKKYC